MSKVIVRCERPAGAPSAFLKGGIASSYRRRFVRAFPKLRCVPAERGSRSTPPQARSRLLDVGLLHQGKREEVTRFDKVRKSLYLSLQNDRGPRGISQSEVAIAEVVAKPLRMYFVKHLAQGPYGLLKRRCRNRLAPRRLKESVSRDSSAARLSRFLRRRSSLRSSAFQPRHAVSAVFRLFPSVASDG